MRLYLGAANKKIAPMKAKMEAEHHPPLKRNVETSIFGGSSRAFFALRVFHPPKICLEGFHPPKTDS